MSSSGVARTALAVYLAACEEAKSHVIVEFLDALHDGSRQCFLSDRQPPLTDVDVSCIAAALRQPHHLRVLDLYSNDLSDEGIGMLMGALVERPGILRELRLGNLGLTDDTATFIARTFSEHNSIGLRVLDLSQNQIGDKGCAELARVVAADSSPLLELSLHSNQLTPAAAGAVAQLVACDRIRHLHLGRNYLGDQAAIAIAEVLPQCRVVSTLDLSENRIGRDGGIALARALCGPGSATSGNGGVCLQRINLRGNLMPRDALVAFIDVARHNRGLAQLFVGCNEGQPSGEDTQELLQALLENDSLLLLDVVGWPLPPGTAWDVADAILSSNTCVRAVVSDAFSDVFEFIDGANHERTLRGQQSIYFGVNEYLGASAVAAATAAGGGARRSDSVPIESAVNVSTASRPAAVLDRRSGSAGRSRSQDQQQTSTSASHSSQQQAQQQVQVQQQFESEQNGPHGTQARGLPHVADDAPYGDQKQSAPPQQHQQQPRDQSNSAYATAPAAVYKSSSSGGNGGGGSNSSRQHPEVERLSESEARLAEVSSRVWQSGGQVQTDDFVDLARVVQDLVQSLKLAHMKIAVLEKRRECRCGDADVNNNSNSSAQAGVRSASTAFVATSSSSVAAQQQQQSSSVYVTANNNNSNSDGMPRTASPLHQPGQQSGGGGGGGGSANTSTHQRFRDPASGNFATTAPAGSNNGVAPSNSNSPYARREQQQQQKQQQSAGTASSFNETQRPAGPAASDSSAGGSRGVSSPTAPVRRGEPGSRPAASAAASASNANNTSAALNSSSSTAASANTSQSRFTASDSRSFAAAANSSSSTSQAQQFSGAGATNRVSVPPLNLANARGDGSTQQQQRQAQRQGQGQGEPVTPSSRRVGEDVRSVSTARGPGGRPVNAVSSVHRSPSSGGSPGQDTDRTNPALGHPYWKHNTPERQRMLDTAEDHPTRGGLANANHASALPHAHKGKDSKGEECPTPLLQASKAIEPSQPLEGVPSPQTPPPRPTIPRGTT